jgi:peptide/nickel transport system substrate-binding protein
MRRRTFLRASAAALAAPSIARGQRTNTLRFIPQSDVTVVDPHVSTT